MYILPRIQKTLFDEGSVRRHKLGSRGAAPVCGTRTRTFKTIKTIFFNKNQFLEWFFREAKGHRGPGGPPVAPRPPPGKFPEKSDFIVFCVRVGEPHTKNACLGPVL
jgi:hypothetical protein